MPALAVSLHTATRIGPEPGLGRSALRTPLLSFIRPSSDITTLPGLPRGRAAARGLRLALDGLQEDGSPTLFHEGVARGVQKELGT